MYTRYYFMSHRRRRRAATANSIRCGFLCSRLPCTDNVPSPTRFFRRLSLLRHDVFPSFPWTATPSSLLYLPVNIALNSEAIHKTYIRDDMDDDGDGPLLCGWSPLHVGTYSYTASATSSLLFWLWGTIHPSIHPVLHEYSRTSSH